MKQKKKSDVAVLLDYAGSHKGLTFLGLALSAVSMLLSMAPYICSWLAARDLSAVAPDWTQAQRCYVLDLAYDGLVVEDGAFTPQTAAPLALRRVIDDVTEIDELPYDGMYVEYLLAKMALYQHDYTGYQAHMTQYNTLYDGLRRDYKSRAPAGGVSALHRYWKV